MNNVIDWRSGSKGDLDEPLAGDRFFRFVLFAIAAGGVGLELIALGPLRTSFWGFHLHAFVPGWIAIVCWATVFASAWVFLGPPGALDPTISKLIRAFEREPVPAWVGALLVSLACACLFWILRSGQDLLGDAWPILKDMPEGRGFHPRQPLTAFIQYYLYESLGPVFAAEGRPPAEVARITVALGSAAAGTLFAIVACGLGRLIAGQTSAGSGGLAAVRPPALLVALVLLAQGYAELYFGYIENYTFNALCNGVYLLAGILYLGGRLPLVIPVLVLIVSVGMHLSSVVLLPSLALLAGVGLSDPRRRTGALRDLVLGLAALFLFDRGLGTLERGYSLSRGLAEVLAAARAGGGSGLESMFSAAHFRDFINEHYLIGPLGAFFFLPALGFAWFKKRAVGASGGFLAVAGLACLAASWVVNDPLGNARDWDLFAPAGVAYTAGALYFLVGGVRESETRVRLLIFALLLSLHHLVPWVMVNHSEARALARFETLPLSRGRTEVVVGRWHLNHGDRAQAALWFDRALSKAPENVNAHAFLGELHLLEGRPELAADAFRRATLIRPDKVEYRRSLVKALNAAHRYEEALPHLDMIVEREPLSYDGWLERGRALAALGQGDEARAAHERALDLAAKAAEQKPGDYQLNLDSGILLAKLGRPEEALASFRIALKAHPASDAALFNLALLLIKMGRREEARPYLERFVAEHPRHPMADRALHWLAGDAEETGDAGMEAREGGAAQKTRQR